MTTDPYTLLAQSWGQTPVGASPDLRRILALPTRHHTPEALEQLCDAWTNFLRAPGGTQRLLPPQAQALAEIFAVKGGFCPVRVGGGKTLISFLCSPVLEAVRPILFVPAGLVEKTRRDLQDAARHWRVPFNLHVMSYEHMGREANAGELEVRLPDLVIFDECHRLKNPKAAVTKRVKRYIKKHRPRVVMLSGTMVSNGVSDCAHLAEWALGAGSPFPVEHHTIRDWASALDEKVRPGTRKALGALEVLTPPGQWPTLENVRKGVFLRMNATPGVVSTAGEQVACGLELTPQEVILGPAAQDLFKRLREKCENPDGVSIAEPMLVWALANQLAMGFHYYLDPAPPDVWLVTRSAWATYARGILQASRGKYDTEKQVRTAVERGELADPLVRPDVLLQQWTMANAGYFGTHKFRWHDRTLLDAAIAWTVANPEPTLIWTWHSAFGRQLAHMLKVPYVGAKGLTEDGLVDDLRGETSCVLSIAANMQGRNLQAWGQNLVCAPPTKGKDWEQLLGRSHRLGQTRDVVTCTILASCREHFRAIARAHSSSRMTRHLMGASQKLLQATWTDVLPDTIKPYPSHRPQADGDHDEWDEYEISALYTD